MSELSAMLTEAGFTDIEVKPTFGHWSIVSSGSREGEGARQAVPNHRLQRTRPLLRFLLKPKVCRQGLAAEGEPLDNILTI
jgi:hypothetical protein